SRLQRKSETRKQAQVDQPMLREAYAQREQLAERGELLRTEQLAEQLGVSRQAISKRLQTGTLFYVDGPQGVRYYPSFFARANLDQSKLRMVSRALGGMSGASKWLFFTTPRVSLGELTPLQVLEGAQ